MNKSARMVTSLMAAFGLTISTLASGATAHGPGLLVSGPQDALGESDGQSPLLLAGQLMSTKEAVSGNVVVDLLPNDSATERLEVGDSQPILRAYSTTTDQAGRFEVHLHPSFVPEEYISENGIVHLRVSGSAAGYLGRWTTSVQVIEDGAGPVWIDPLDAEAAASQRESSTRDQILHPVHVAIPVTAPIPTSLAAAGADESEPTGNARAVAGLGSDGEDVGILSGPSLTCYSRTLMSRHYVWTWVGDSWPVSNVTGKLKYNATHTTSFGVGWSGSGSYGQWSASGTKSHSAGWGFTWNSSSSKRYYQKEMEYGKYRWNCGDYLNWYEWTFEPIRDTGGTATYVTSESPTWSNCRPVATGQWERSSTSGSNYVL